YSYHLLIVWWRVVIISISLGDRCLKFHLLLMYSIVIGIIPKWKRRKMPTYINIEKALFEWQAKHGQRMTNEELADRAGLSIAALYRMKSGDMLQPDLRKINELCKVLECEPGDIIMREPTRPIDEAMRLEVERLEILHELEEKFQRKRDRDEATSTG